MTDILQLLPCPFCGGRPRIDHTDGGGSFIECAKCGASSAVHYGRMENLIPSWNRRALEADNVRLREALTRLVAWEGPVELACPELGGLLKAMYDARAALESK